MRHQIEFRHLRYFLAVAEELHFRKAADKLFVSQPGLSRQIKQMEEELGFPLFERTNKRVTLTKAGKYLKEEVALIFKNVEDTFDHAQLIHEGMEGQISFAYVGSAMQNVIPELILKIREDHPNIHYSLREMENPEQIDALLLNDVDLAFVRLEKVPKGLDIRPVFEDTFSLVVPENYELENIDLNSLTQFKNEDFILFDPSYSPAYYEQVMEIFKQSGFQPIISHNTVHASTIFRLVENNLGLSIVPSSLKLGYDMKVKFIELNQMPQRTVLSVAWNKSNRNPILGKILSKISMRK
ncbi:LysR family transcriptional regulator [Lutimonas halocynthiae]|uniref:LysR family transcriptional regulator n=1 Tax=Lutimonas halocynthiae TaxID=1446477 RepID=UPI0025B3AB60|nr:LysR family transcriptional regulator [Lutimonas halocynthiae]MDN3641314.1 LysR family transcriptional regulator [Lutimonas halocynthiae]